MKKFIVKHWIASYWIMTLVVFITLLLLCGPAQACENIDCKPDAVREWNGDTSFVDWPCGRTDTVVTEPVINISWDDSYVKAKAVAAGPAPNDDTVIVPAIGIDDARLYRGPGICARCGREHYGDCSKPWTQFPERWYVKSVDTTWGDSIRILLPGYEDFGGYSEELVWHYPDFKIDTTWAKKASLVDVYLTPNQVIKLKWLVGAVTPDTIPSTSNITDD